MGLDVKCIECNVECMGLDVKCIGCDVEYLGCYVECLRWGCEMCRMGHCVFKKGCRVCGIWSILVAMWNVWKLFEIHIYYCFIFSEKYNTMKVEPCDSPPSDTVQNGRPSSTPITDGYQKSIKGWFLCYI